MIKLKHLLTEWEHDKRPSSLLDSFILKNHVQIFNGTVYHGSPPDGLKSIITEGIRGTEHGEIAEYETFSTSVNSGVLNLFSEGHGRTGIECEVQGIKVVVLDSFLHKLMCELPGSGMEVDVDEEAFKEFCSKYAVPHGAWNRDEYFLPYNYLSSLGVDAFSFDYVWKQISHDITPPHNDESEIAFIGAGIRKLNSMAETIWVNGHTFSIKEKARALEAIEEYA